MEIYCKAGIPDYCLVDPGESILEAYMLEGENYLLIFTGGPEDKFVHPEFAELNLDLKQNYLTYFWRLLMLQVKTMWADW